MSGPVLTSLNIQLEDGVIAVRENRRANSNFILSSVLGKCFSEKENVCLVLTHNTVGHYHNIGRRLGYDLLDQIKTGKAKSVDFLKNVSEGITNMDVKTTIVNLFNNILDSLSVFEQSGVRTTLIIEDVSDLSNFGVEFRFVLGLMRFCIGMTRTHNVRLVINCHVETASDERLSNFLFHNADLMVTVSALRTGVSRNVSGILEIMRPEYYVKKDTNRLTLYHYKLNDKCINTFAPGRVGM